MTAPSSPPADLAVVAAYQAQTAALREELAARIAALWVALGSYRQPDIGRFLQQVVPLVAAAQRQMSSLTVGYLAAQRRTVIGRSLTVRVNPVTVTGAAVRNGVEPAVVYERPFHLVWRQLDELPHVPGAIEQAITAGQNRAVQSALTDLQLAKTHTTQQVSEADNRVVWKQRVLEGAASCGLCIVASTQRYHASPKELLPIHPGCDCSERLVYGDHDPGQIIDLDRLQGVHDRIEEAFGASSSAAREIPGTATPTEEALHYRDVLVTHEHGELGPVLAVRGQKFTGPNDL